MSGWLGLAGARARRLGLVATLACAACAPERIGPPPNAPTVLRALDAMPGDLDLVVRLDLHRIRDTLGSAAMTALTEQAIRGSRGADQATDALLIGALAETDTLWLGLRPAQEFSGSDSVFVMTGHFPKFDPQHVASKPAFQKPIELGGAFRRYDRAAPAQRSAPARIYTRGDDLIVSVSEAEIDSVERSLEQRRGSPPLEPAEKGALSAVARPRILPASVLEASPSLQKLAARATRCELSADLTSAGVDATLGLKFEDPNTAERLAVALVELRDALKVAPGRLAKLAARLEITSAAEFVTLRLAIGRDELSEIVNCRGSACAW
jgi:hypothetical protein